MSEVIQPMKTENFDSKLALWTSGQKASRDALQELLQDAFRMAAPKDEGGNENYARLTKIVEACVGVRSVPTRVIQAYITQHAEVRWVKPKGEEGRYKKSGHGGVTMPKVTWYNWEGNKANQSAKVDLPLMTRLKSLVSQCETAKKEGRLKDPDNVLGQLEQLVGRKAKMEA